MKKYLVVEDDDFYNNGNNNVFGIFDSLQDAKIEIIMLERFDDEEYIYCKYKIIEKEEDN